MTMVTEVLGKKDSSHCDLGKFAVSRPELSCISTQAQAVVSNIHVNLFQLEQQLGYAAAAAAAAVGGGAAGAAAAAAAAAGQAAMCQQAAAVTAAAGGVGQVAGQQSGQVAVAGGGHHQDPHAAAAAAAAGIHVDLDSATESNHDTALTLACAGGHEDLVTLLLGRGADIGT